MTAFRWFGSIVLAGALVAGCDDKKSTEPNTSNTNTNHTDAVKNGVDKAVAPIKSGVNTAVDHTKAAANEAANKATNAAANVKTEAAEWTKKVDDAIKANKLDEAKTYMDKLEAIKASLPADVQAKIEALRNTYNAAKLKGGNLLGK